MRLLVVGFGPFPGVPRNPAGLLAEAIGADRRWARRGVAVDVLVLPTTYAALPERLVPALMQAPDAVLMIGVAARRKRVTVERRAVNRVSRLFPDASGQVGTRLAFAPGEPHRRKGGPAAERVLRAIRGSGIDARASLDAGRYLCNASYFTALGLAPGRTVFVHVPLPRRSGHERKPSLAAMASALTRAAEGLLRPAAPRDAGIRP